MCSFVLRSVKRISLLKTNVSLLSTVTQTDLQGQFLNPRIHNLLHKIASSSENTKIHESRFKVEKEHNIKLLSDEELDSVLKYSEILTSQKLQMPPVMSERPKIDHEQLVIARNPELCGILPANQKLAFVDTGLDSTRRHRLMVVREADGTLRHADAAERDRYNQIFFPLPGRRLRTPSLFRGSNLDVALSNNQHEYILDLILLQFEPDSPEYIRVSHLVYQDAASKCWTQLQASERPNPNVVTALRSTRHYGPLALFVISRLRQPECLIQEALFHQSLDTVHKLLVLTTLLHPDSEFAKQAASHGIPSPNPDSDCVVPDNSAVLDLVRTFIDTWPLEPEQKNQLNLSLSQCHLTVESGGDTHHSEAC